MEPTSTSQTPVGRRGPQNNAEFWHPKKKMALRNGSTPPPDPRVHPEHRFRRRAGVAAGSPCTGTNRFRPSITQLIELSDGCILMVWCIKLNS